MTKTFQSSLYQILETIVQATSNLNFFFNVGPLFRPTHDQEIKRKLQILKKLEKHQLLSEQKFQLLRQTPVSKCNPFCQLFPFLSFCLPFFTALFICLSSVWQNFLFKTMGFYVRPKCCFNKLQALCNTKTLFQQTWVQAIYVEKRQFELRMPPLRVIPC